MKLLKLTLAIIFLLGNTKIFAQSKNLGFGTWKAAYNNIANYPFAGIKGSMVRVNWDDIQSTETTWDWTKLDQRLNINAGSPIILLVWIWNAGSDLKPDFLFSLPPAGIGLPKVHVYTKSCQGACRENDDQPTVETCYECLAPEWYNSYDAPPFYLSDYRARIKILIDKVKERITYGRANSLSGYNNIIAVQACLGSTGDYPSYKGAVKSVPITPEALTDFSGYFREMAQYFDSTYLNSEGTYVMHNPGNDPNLQLSWVNGGTLNNPNLHYPWIKMGDVGHAYQLNKEMDYYNSLLSNGYFLSKPRTIGDIKIAEYVRSRGEMSTDVTGAGWWKNITTVNNISYDNAPRHMLALFGSALTFGLDLSNQLNEDLSGLTNKYQLAYEFYNRQAGQKDPSIGTNAFCMLRDGLDASDVNRFPSSLQWGYYPSQDLTDRFQKIVAGTGRGALLLDVADAIKSSGYNRVATGINDVGDKIMRGNYEKYLHLIRPPGIGSDDDPENRTSLGYWNVNATNQPNSIYGRFARGISNSNGKNALYFDILNSFYNPGSLGNGCSYEWLISVTYLDDWDGVGVQPSWDFYYNRIKMSCPSGKVVGEDYKSETVSIGTTNKWVTKTFDILNAYFGNSGEQLPGDFSIRTNSNAVIKFALVEIQTRILLGGPFHNLISTMCYVCPRFSSPAITSNLKIFPNPAENKFSIELNNKKLMSEITIYNQFSKIVFHKKINSFSTNISRFDLGNLSGLYFVNVTTIDGEIIKKELKLL